MTKHLASLSVLAALALAAPAMAEVKTSQTGMGPVLTDGQGMTLYTYDKDEAGKSNCTGDCAKNWPPLAADGSEKGDLSAIARPDGGKQVAYKGKPLYLWVKDTKPGDTTGDGVKGVWHVAKP
ncbi:MAG TPA: hypothetical protein VLL76_11530 [Candidatus Omnitrophota bacterium]|nr:hypothetical protein [Candidatus Omnitrophota bacterium]